MDEALGFVEQLELYALSINGLDLEGHALSCIPFHHDKHTT